MGADNYIADSLDEKVISELIADNNIIVEVYDSIDSTNLELKRRIKDRRVSLDKLTLVVANEQTGGRGRLGRTFESPKGSGIYMSLHLRPKNIEEDAMLITTAAGVAVARGFSEACGVESQIKWVNDIYVDGRKVCGILAEAVMDSDGVMNIILGIGMNITTTSEEFGEEVRNVAGALYAGTNSQVVSRNEIVAAVTSSFINIYNNIADREYMKEYRERSMVLGKEVRYLKNDEWYEAIVKEIDDDGGLVVDTNGVISTLRTGEITLRLR